MDTEAIATAGLPTVGLPFSQPPAILHEDVSCILHEEEGDVS
jgi:hypothetical protein